MSNRGDKKLIAYRKQELTGCFLFPETLTKVNFSGVFKSICSEPREKTELTLTGLNFCVLHLISLFS